MGIIGIIANPASGKDVRRLVARASVFDNQEKQAIVGRVLAGIQGASGTACHIVYLDDSHGITRGALEAAGGRLDARPVAPAGTVSALDTIRAAQHFESLGCSVVVTLGGDGTNRAVALGWPDAPLIAISTGTNNVFPVLVEGTVAGAAAGLVASGQISLDTVASRTKAITVQIEGQGDDLALIDAVLSSERFVGSRALLAPEHLRAALLTRADPAAVGMTALGGLIQPLSDADAGGLLLTLAAEGDSVHAPIAPGHYRSIGIRSCRHVPFGERTVLAGPGMLAFDGERERVLAPGQRAHLTIDRAGPRVVSVHRTLNLAAREGRFCQSHVLRNNTGT
jgi:hypothetical protein